MRTLLALVALAACGGATPTASPPPLSQAAPVTPVAIAFVYQSDELYVGNDDIEPDDSPARQLGILKGLKRAIDRATLSTELPFGSVALAISYAERARVVVATGPAGDLTGASLGGQKDYYRNSGLNLVAGVELAQAELVKTGAAKKILVIFGDGNDTNNEAARGSLAKLRRQLATEHVEVRAMIYKGGFSAQSEVVSVLDPAVETVASTEAFDRRLHHMLRECCRVAHPNANPAPLALAIVFNGREIYMGNDDLEPAGSQALHHGLLKALKTAVDHADLAGTLPAGSVGTAIAYNDSAIAKVPLGPVSHLTGSALGTQKDYYSTIGTDLVSGVTLAEDQLLDSGATKKVLIVIGDGNDTNNDGAKPALAKLRTELLAAHGEIHALVWTGELSDAPHLAQVLDASSTTLAKPSDLAAALAKVIADCCRR